MVLAVFTTASADGRSTVTVTRRATVCAMMGSLDTTVLGHVRMASLDQTVKRGKY